MLRPTAAHDAGWLSSPALAGAIVVLALCLRLAFVAVTHIPPESDYLDYWRMALNAYEGRGLVDTFGNRAFFSPGYAFFLYGLFHLTGPSLIAAQAANAILGAVSVWLVYAITLRVASHGPAVIAAALLAVYLEAIVYAEYLAKENLMIALLLAQIAIAYRVADTRSSANWSVLLGVLLGFQALVATAAGAVVPGLLLILWSGLRSLRALISRGLIIVAVVAITTAPWFWRNYDLFGAPVLTTNGGFNLYLGNNPNATAMFSGIETTPVATEWRSLRAAHGEHGIDRLLGRMALEHMRAEPVQTARLAIEKLAAFWTPPLHAGESGTTASRAERAARLIWAAQWLLIVLASILPLRHWRTSGRRLLPIYVMVGCYTALHMLIYVIFRYRLPMMPLLCIAAGMGLWPVVKSFLSRFASALPQRPARARDQAPAVSRR